MCKFKIYTCRLQEQAVLVGPAHASFGCRVTCLIIAQSKVTVQCHHLDGLGRGKLVRLVSLNNVQLLSQICDHSPLSVKYGHATQTHKLHNNTFEYSAF